MKYRSSCGSGVGNNDYDDQIVAQKLGIHMLAGHKEIKKIQKAPKPEATA